MWELLFSVRVCIFTGNNWGFSSLLLAMPSSCGACTYPNKRGKYCTPCAANPPWRWCGACACCCAHASHSYCHRRVSAGTGCWSICFRPKGAAHQEGQEGIPYRRASSCTSIWQTQCSCLGAGSVALQGWGGGKRLFFNKNINLQGMCCGVGSCACWHQKARLLHCCSCWDAHCSLVHIAIREPKHWEGDSGHQQDPSIHFCQ